LESNPKFRKELLSKLIKNYEKRKKTLDQRQRNFVEKRINVFKKILRNPKTSFYFDQNNEIQLGKIQHDLCLYCQKDLQKLRHSSYPKFSKNTERYCSKSCMIQHSKMKAIIEKYGADRIFWGKYFVRLVYDQKCDNYKRKKPHGPLTVDLPTRKTRTKNFKG